MIAMYQSYFKTSSNYVLPDQFDEILHIDSTNKIEEVDISSKGTSGFSLWFRYNNWLFISVGL